MLSPGKLNTKVYDDLIVLSDDHLDHNNEKIEYDKYQYESEKATERLNYNQSIELNQNSNKEDTDRNNIIQFKIKKNPKK